MIRVKNLLLFVFLIQGNILFGQNVKLEISNYLQKMGGKEFATFQFAHASYSASRPTLILITNREVCIKLMQRIPKLFNVKQERTDVWVLGIQDYRGKNISGNDSLIIGNFFEKIIKYRRDNDLHLFSMDDLWEKKYDINDVEDVCRYLVCR